MLNKTKCWVPTCLNPNLDPNKKAFPLPKDAEIREVWLALSGKPTETICTKEIIFCQDHFSTQDIIRMDEKQYHNKHKIVPINYMPDRMCGTCMSLIPPEHSFHIVSSKFPSEMPPVVKEILNFMVPSKPEPLHQIFTFCMKELKLPRDPPPVVCNDCYINAWVYFVFKMTCIEVEKDLKADMSWENYGKKVLCRSCPQTMGTNFITLLSSPSMANLLQNMFIGHCPPPEIVPLQVCITCYNVLQRIDRFNKNCLEAGEKMERHLALQKKYYRLSDSNIPSSSTVFTKSRANNRVSDMSLRSDRGSVEKMSDKTKVQNVGSSRSNKVLLAQLMLEHGQMLRTDLYQEDVWSIICEKMQQKGVGCNVPGLMNVWREMVHDTNTKFDAKQPISLCDKLIMEFYKTTQNFHLSKSNVKAPSTVSTTVAPNIPPLLENTENKSMYESESESEKQIPVLEDESKPISTSKPDKKTPIELPNKLSAWTDENKSDFLDIFEKEYIQYTSKMEDMGKRRPWKTICMNIATSGYYNIKDDTFFHRLWMHMKSKAEEDSKTKPSPLTKKVLLFLKRDNIIFSGKPLPFTNDEKIHLIKLCDKHMPLNEGKWPPQPEYWQAVTKDFAAVNPFHNAESVKRGHKNLRAKIRSRIEGPHDDIDKLMIKHLEGVPGVLENYGYKVEQNGKQKKKKDGKSVASGGDGGRPSPNKTDSKQPSPANQSITTEAPKESSPKTPARSMIDKQKLAADLIDMFDSFSDQQIIEMDKSIWTTMTRKIIERGDFVGNFNSLYASWRSIRLNATLDKTGKNSMYVRVQDMLKRHAEIVKGAQKKSDPVAADAASKQPATPKQPEKPARRSVGRSPVMTFEAKRQFVDDFIREYKLLVQLDPSFANSRSPWTVVAQRVAEKTTGMTFLRAYNLWSRFKMSAKSHERDGSDPIDVLVWDLLERHREMVKNWKAEPKDQKAESKDRKAESKDQKVVENGRAAVVGAPAHPPADIASKKRPIDPSEHAQPAAGAKKKKYAVLDESAFGRLQQQRDEILALLAATHARMLDSGEQPDLRWKHVIDRIYRDGGYRDVSHKDFVCLFNRMRSELSTRKASGATTPFDRQLEEVLRAAAAAKQARAARGGGGGSGGGRPAGKYERDRAYRPSQRLPPVEGRPAGGGGGGAEGARKRRSVSRVGFEMDEAAFSDIEGEMYDSPTKKPAWTEAEKLALITSARKRGSAVFHHPPRQGGQLWAGIAEELRAQGYPRSAQAVRGYWHHLRRRAERAWAGQAEPTGADEALIEFMTSAIREKEEPAGAAGSDSDGREGAVDLTYDYVSFDDIERLSLEAAGGRVSVKAEGGVGPTHDVGDGTSSSLLGADHPSVDFVLTKVEGGIEYNDEEEEIESSQPEYVSAAEIGLVKIRESPERDDAPESIEYMLVDGAGAEGREGGGVLGGEEVGRAEVVPAVAGAGTD